MANYTQFAPFYDAVMGDRKEATDFLLGLVREYHPGGNRMRGVVTGTGIIVRRMAKVDIDIWSHRA